MRQLRRLLSVLVMAVTIVGMSVTAFAQEKDSGVGGLGSLTIANASKGVVYSVYKVFDAKVNADGTSVAYTKKYLADIKIYRSSIRLLLCHQHFKRWRYDHGNECCKRRADRGQKQ